MLFALLFFLLATHALMDYALQSDAIATCKCRKCDSPVAKSVPWYYWLTAHAVLHGAAIGAVVRWFGFGWDAVAILAFAETFIHWLIDFGKCEKWYGIDVDQSMHVACRLVWFGLLALGVFGPLPPGVTMPRASAARAGRGWELLLAILAALAAGGAGGYLVALRAGTPGGSTADPPAARAERVTALGRLQPAGGIVPVIGPPGDRIAVMHPVAPGAELKAGTAVAELASRKDRLQELQVAETQQQESVNALKFARIAGEQRVRAATAELNQAKANKESDLAALDARLAYLKVQADTATAGVARLEKLRTSGVTVAEENMEKAKLLAAQSDAELKAGDAQRKKTETSYDESQKAAEAKIAAAKAELDEAIAKVPTKSTEEKLALARQLAEHTILKAPITGTVLKVTGREGQPTGMEPILQMGDLSAMTAVAEVYESDIERLSKWVQAAPVKAEIKNPALPRPLSGVVRSGQDISRMIARNQVFALGPREDSDRRVVEVVVHLNPDATADAGRFVGIQVTVTLEPGKEDRLPACPRQRQAGSLSYEKT